MFYSKLVQTFIALLMVAGGAKSFGQTFSFTIEEKSQEVVAPAIEPYPGKVMSSDAIELGNLLIDPGFQACKEQLSIIPAADLKFKQVTFFPETKNTKTYILLFSQITHGDFKTWDIKMVVTALTTLNGFGGQPVKTYTCEIDTVEP